MRVILTRHYRTLSNAEGRILGWGNSPPCPGWNADVDFIAEQLRKKVSGFDEVYSSELQRARQTARVYAGIFGVAEVFSVSQLNEVNYGQLQTREKSWVYKHYPRHKADPNFIYPGGESFAQMQQRGTRFLSSLALAQPDRTVLIVAHAGLIRGLVSHFLALDYASSLKHTIPFRYIGDFLFEQEHCVRYDELGETSGFVKNNVVRIPLDLSHALT